MVSVKTVQSELTRVSREAAKYGFIYSSLTDEFFNKAGVRLPASAIQNGQENTLLAAMKHAAQESDEAANSQVVVGGYYSGYVPPGHDYLGQALHISGGQLNGMVVGAGWRGTGAQGMPPGAPIKPVKRSPYEKLAVRLDVPAGETFQYDHVHIVETSTEVCVLIKTNDQVILLRDDANLYPSDTLIASIRLLD